MKIFYKLLNGSLILALAAGLIFYFENDIRLVLNNLNKQLRPCEEPLAYSIGKIDPKFGLSREDLLKAIGRAAQIWQQPINKKLFNYADSGALKINLIYDSRQEATDKLKDLGINIHSDQASYEILKSKYAAFDKIYQAQQAEFDNLVAYYGEQKANYEDEVKAAERRGGVTPAEYAILEEERQELNKLIESIKQKQTTLNKTAGDINAVARVINKLIGELNLRVDNYNTIGAKASGEFQAGQYTSAAAGVSINIYQFDNQAFLIRVLAHELGHALGLEHLENSKAIMYRLNESGNEKITADDIKELKTVCRIK